MELILYIMIRDNEEGFHLNPTEPMATSSDITELHAEDFL